MADNISIVMTLNDQISGKLKTIANTAQGCSKATEELARKSQQLGDRYKDLQKQSAGASAEALEVKRAMDEAAKSFKKTGDEADLLNFEKLKERYNDLTVSAKGYAAAAQATVKEIRTLDEEVRKMDLSGSIGQTGGEGLSIPAKVEELPEQFWVDLLFDESAGLPRDLEGLVEALREIMPAHLGWGFRFSLELEGALRVGGTFGTLVTLPIPEAPDEMKWRGALYIGGTYATLVTLPVPEQT